MLRKEYVSAFSSLKPRVSCTTGTPRSSSAICLNASQAACRVSAQRRKEGPSSIGYGAMNDEGTSRTDSDHHEPDRVQVLYLTTRPWRVAYAINGHIDVAPERHLGRFRVVDTQFLQIVD